MQTVGTKRSRKISVEALAENGVDKLATETRGAGTWRLGYEIQVRWRWSRVMGTCMTIFIFLTEKPIWVGKTLGLVIHFTIRILNQSRILSWYIIKRSWTQAFYFKVLFFYHLNYHLGALSDNLAGSVRNKRNKRKKKEKGLGRVPHQEHLDWFRFLKAGNQNWTEKLVVLLFYYLKPIIFFSVETIIDDGIPDNFGFKRLICSPLQYMVVFLLLN